jgi:hypothetical protein
MSVPGGAKRFGIVAVATMALAASSLAATSNPAGSVKQVPGTAGCYTIDGSSEDGADTCTDVRGSIGDNTVAISPDDRFAYSVGYGDDPPVSAIQVYRRSSKTGALHQLAGRSGCVSLDGSSEDGPHTCANGRQIDTGDGHSIAISADGRFLYSGSQLEIASDHAGGVAIFKRNRKTGKITQLKGKAGCVSYKGLSEDGPHTCAQAREVDLSNGVQLSRDGRFLYSMNYGDIGGIAIFHRSKRSGKLHQLKGKNGCITSSGGASQLSGHLCRAGVKLDTTWELALPDNKFVYAPATDEDLVAGFRRNKAGGLVPLKGKSGCVSDDGSSAAGFGTCVNGRGMDDVERVLLSRDRRYIYAQSYTPTQAAVLDRDPKTGALSQRSGKGSCMSADGSSADGADTCGVGRGFDGSYAGVVSRDGKTMYFANYNAGGFAVMRLNQKTGAFKQLAGKQGCVTVDGSSDAGPDTCIDGVGTAGAYETTLSHDGRDLYVASYDSSGIAHFRVRR